MESEIRRQLANAKNELDNLGATCQEVKNSLILLKVDLTFYPGPCGTRIDNPLERFIQRYGYWTVDGDSFGEDRGYARHYFGSSGSTRELIRLELSQACKDFYATWHKEKYPSPVRPTYDSGID